MSTGDRVVVARDLAAAGPRPVRPMAGHVGTVEHIATQGTFAGRIKVNLDGRGPAWFKAEELAVIA